MGRALSRVNKKQGSLPSRHLLSSGETKHVFNIYATFSNRPLCRLEKLDNRYKISLEYEVSMANAAFDYYMPSY